MDEAVRLAEVGSSVLVADGQSQDDVASVPGDLVRGDAPGAGLRVAQGLLGPDVQLRALLWFPPNRGGLLYAASRMGAVAFSWLIGLIMSAELCRRSWL